MKQLLLFRITQTTRNEYDTYDSAVVAAFDSSAARRYHPNGMVLEYRGKVKFTPRRQAEIDESRERNPDYRPVATWDSYSWTDVKNVTAELVGIASPHIQPGVIISSFNAG